MLAATIREASRRFGERTAYVTEAGWSVTYGDLDTVSDEIAAGLAARGVGTGDVVALVLPPGPEYLFAYLANAKVGAVTAGVNDRLSERERDAVLAVAGPKLTFAAPGFAPKHRDAIEVTPAADLDGVLRDLRDPSNGTAPAHDA